MNDKNILLVEDNDDDVQLTRRALEKAHIGNPLIVVRDGAAALEYLFDDNLPHPCLILLDINLPKLDGHEVLKRLRANARTKLLPVVMLTTSDEESDRLRSYSLGCNSYVRKPVDFARFVEAVKQLGLYWIILNRPPPSGGAADV